MKVGELRAFIADKSDNDDVEIATVPNYVINIKPVQEPVLEEKVVDASVVVPEAENAAEATTEAVVDAPVSE